MGTNISVKMESKECKMKGTGYCPQPLERANSFLSKKWTISIITTIGNFNRLRFNDILNRVEGITGKTLSERLKELERLKLIKRTVYKEIPPRVDYELTQKGKKLRKAIVPLIEWANLK
jgi:DNA-binding HxlR family transcriptional regulator